MEHLIENNVDEIPPANPFAVGPATLSHVECQPPDAPLSAERIATLDMRLAQVYDLSTVDMSIRHLVWVQALRICQELILYD